MSTISLQPSHATPQPQLGGLILRWANRILAITVWASAFLFGLYILSFYVVAVFGNDLSCGIQASLSNLYKEGEPIATTGMGGHFALGALILILGNIQLIGCIKDRYPPSTDGGYFEWWHFDYHQLAGRHVHRDRAGRGRGFEWRTVD